jgi:hypothetical protein
MFGRLAEAGVEQGSLGRAAKDVESVMKAHAGNEDLYGLPALGLLPLLAAGFAWPEMRPAVAMASTLHSSLPQMLEEHDALISALEQLECVARRHNRHDLAMLAQTLVHHVESETEVLYPAAIVAGKYLDTQLKRKDTK